MIPERQKGHVYYRCHTPSCETKTVREEAIEAAVVRLLRRVEIKPKHIAIVTRRFASWAKERYDTASSTIELQVAQIKERLERLTDALIDRLIEKTAFAERQQTLLVEKAALEDRLAKEQRLPTNPAHITRFLELIKSLARTYEIAESAEKRQLVEMATSNRSLLGKNVYLEPANWLSTATSAVSVLIGGPERDTDRTYEAALFELIGALNEHESVSPTIYEEYEIMHHSDDDKQFML